MAFYLHPMALPDVSLVVLNYNGREHLETSLSSLSKQAYPAGKLDLIVCDNGSTDGSADYVRANFPKARVVELDDNYGFAGGNNRAAKAAQCEWVGFVNNDLRFPEDWLANLVAGLEQRPDAACLSSRITSWDGSRIDFVGGGVNVFGHGFQVDYGKARSKHDRPRQLLYPCGGAMLVRRQAFEEVGGWDEDFFGFFEDVDLGWRMTLRGHETWYTPAASVFHRLHSTYDRMRAYRVQVLYQRNALHVIFKCLEDANLAAALPAALYLLNERALTMAGVNRSDYRIEGRRPESNAVAATPAAAAQARGLASRAARVLREGGPRELAVRSGRYLRKRIGAPRLQEIPADHTLVPNMALSQYVGLSDFAHNLERMLEKRREIQATRLVSDADLIPLMVDPTWPNYQEPSYLRFHEWLVKVLGLEERFAVPQGAPN